MAILPANSSMASQQIQSAFEPDVNLDRCIYREEFNEPASSYIIKSSETGSRTIVNYNELPEMSVDELKRVIDEVGPKTTWFHFEVSLHFTPEAVNGSDIDDSGPHTRCRSGWYQIYPSTVPVGAG